MKYICYLSFLLLVWSCDEQQTGSVEEIDPKNEIAVREQIWALFRTQNTQKFYFSDILTTYRKPDLKEDYVHRGGGFALLEKIDKPKKSIIYHDSNLGDFIFVVDASGWVVFAEDEKLMYCRVSENQYRVRLKATYNSNHQEIEQGNETGLRSEF